MKLNRILLWGATLILLPSCIDNNYDLSDIDTTSEFKVKDLVLPVNMDPVYLSDIIKVEEGDRIKEVTINGKTFYAVEQSGDFNSDGIDVDRFEADAEPMEDKVATFRPLISTLPLSSNRKANSSEVDFYLVEPVVEDIEYKADDIDGSVKALTKIYCENLDFVIDVRTSSLDASIGSELRDLNLHLPNGLNVTAIVAGGISYPASLYNYNDGSITLEKVPMTNNATNIKITADAINLELNECTFRYDGNTDTSSLDMVSQFNIESCGLNLTGEADKLAGITEIVYDVKYSLDPLKATSILGNIQYDLTGTGLYIDPIDLENLPGFLDDPETNLILANPQIYLNLKNPVGKYGLYYQSSLDILAKRDDSEKSFTSPLIKVPAITGDYNFLLAPHPEIVTDIPEDYSTNVERLIYSDLGNILAGNGLPKMLDIELIDPEIPEQTVTSPFELGQNIEGMEGTYMFLAPLALEDGSRIIKTVDGWWSEDLADLTIQILKITAVASSTVPMDVILNVYPIDKDGNRIETATSSTVKLDANTPDQPIELVMEGTITNLDGIRLYVMGASEDGKPLAPDQIITLDDIKAKVTGNYIRKL